MEINHLCLGCMSDKGENAICPYCGWVEGSDPESGQHLPVGTVLQKKYLLGRVLGQGGFGITYLAWDLDLNIKLAIKEYLPRDFATRTLGETQVSIYPGDATTYFAEGREKFLEEARTLARFDDHPNIVSVRDFFRENQTAYFVMTYIEGMTLKEYLKQQGNSLDFSTSLAIMMPVMDALKEVHSIGILHRDISPDNIFLTDKGVVKLLDFGAARQALGEHSKSLSVILKPGYAPEEQYRSKGNQGPWTDIYAVGATFYRLITGQVPPEALDRMAGEEIVPPSRTGKEIPADSEAALMKALAVQSGQRFQNMNEFQQALTSSGQADAGPLPVDTPRAYQAPRPEPAPVPDKTPSRLLLAGIIALVLSLLGGGGWWFFSSQQVTSASYSFDDGRRYTGSLKGGVPDGFGVCQVTSQGEYQGEWKAGQEVGKHTFAYSNGNQYVGEMKNGVPSGQGTMTSTNGTTFTGGWKEGKMEGQGTLTSVNKSKYEGQWKGGSQNGQGRYTFNDGNVYTGEFRDGVMSGKGTFNYIDGSSYTGDVVNGMRDGQGVYSWPNGDKYEGAFVNGYKNGRGRLTFANGQVKEGLWTKDTFAG
ncbi:MAG TPA: protein kinase [Syntrophomonadaceae bacterium]|nr:protein kinase [Syntrophomonadaceae bacterium]